MDLKIAPEVTEKGTCERHLLYQAAATINGVTLAYCFNQERQEKIDDLTRYAPATIFFELMEHGYWVLDIEKLINATFNKAAVNLSLRNSVYDGKRVIFTPPEQKQLTKDEIFFQLELMDKQVGQDSGLNAPAKATFDGDVDSVNSNATRNPNSDSDAFDPMDIVPLNVTPAAIIAQAIVSLNSPAQPGSVPAKTEAGKPV